MGSEEKFLGVCINILDKRRCKSKFYLRKSDVNWHIHLEKLLKLKA